MIEERGNMWDISGDVHVVTTNGFVKKNGAAVMGRGCAAQAKKRYPGLDMELGLKIKERGNIVHKLSHNLVSFPVKPVIFRVTEKNVVRHMRSKFMVGDVAPGWASVAVPKIIEKSAIELKELADANGWERVIMPRPGCGAGELGWEEVKQILDGILDDRFCVVTY